MPYYPRIKVETFFFTINEDNEEQAVQ